MAKARTYVVKEKGKKRRLVKAGSHAAVTKHLVQDRYDISPASVDEVVELMKSGVEVEDATQTITEEEPATTE